MAAVPQEDAADRLSDPALDRESLREFLEDRELRSRLFAVRTSADPLKAALPCSGTGYLALSLRAVQIRGAGGGSRTHTSPSAQGILRNERGNEISKLVTRCPFPFPRITGSDRILRGLWTPRWTPVSRTRRRWVRTGDWTPFSRSARVNGRSVRKNADSGVDMDIDWITFDPRCSVEGLVSPASRWACGAESGRWRSSSTSITRMYRRSR